MDHAGAAAWELLVRVAWHGERAEDPDRAVLDRALRLARFNDVEPLLVDAYSARLARETRAIDAAVGLFQQNLAFACKRLDDAAVSAVLIKALPTDRYMYSNFDVVVGDDGWDAAVSCLAAWAPRTSAHPLERTKLLLYPVAGPAVHLHRSVAWFDVPIISTPQLRQRSTRPRGSPVNLPDGPDALRILLAHALFQNLSLSLGELLEYRALIENGTEAEARARARREGWVRGFDVATRTARQTIRSLDTLRPTPLPVGLPTLGSVVTGAEHAMHLATSGRRRLAVREVALRGPLIIAKRRAVARTRRS